MKTDKYQKRFYRGWIKPAGLFSSQITIGQTDLQILTDKKADRAFITEKIKFSRKQIEEYIYKDERFLTTLKPITVELKAPKIVRKMSRASALADVGPMACVAGAIAETLGRDLLKAGMKEIIIENGGDIFLKISKTRNIGIYAGDSKLSNRLKLKINPRDTPMGICCSSGTIGHSLSFGCADSVVILAKNAFLADAAATTVCNRVQSGKDFTKALDFALSIKGVLGAVIILGDNLAARGKIEFA
ncbi:MAG: UPF0280 family protein [Candidatus Omnitrophota bacterium]